MDAEVIFFLSGKRIELSLRAEEQLGLTELTVNSCFSALSLFSNICFLSCVPPHLSFSFFSLKKFPEKEWHFKYFIYLCTKIPILLTPS